MSHIRIDPDAIQTAFKRVWVEKAKDIKFRMRFFKKHDINSIPKFLSNKKKQKTTFFLFKFVQIWKRYQNTQINI